MSKLRPKYPRGGRGYHTNETNLQAWPHQWSVQVLAQPPMIAPASQYTYPLAVPGEEDALARGALYLSVRPAPGAGEFLAICARGFQDPAMPTGVYAMPNPRELCAVAGGYGYIIDTSNPARSAQIPLRPITAVRAGHNLLLCCGFHTVVAWGSEGLVWTTERLSWDGIWLGEVENGHLSGLGWDMMADREVPFSIDLATGRHSGGGFRRTR